MAKSILFTYTDGYKLTITESRSKIFLSLENSEEGTASIILPVKVVRNMVVFLQNLIEEPRRKRDSKNVSV